MLNSKDNSADLYTNEGMDLKNGSSLVTSGRAYTRFYNENSYKLVFIVFILKSDDIYFLRCKDDFGDTNWLLPARLKPPKQTIRYIQGKFLFRAGQI